MYKGCGGDGIPGQLLELRYGGFLGRAAEWMVLPGALGRRSAPWPQLSDGPCPATCQIPPFCSSVWPGWAPSWSGSAPSPCFQPYAGHPWLPELLVMSWERQFALPFRVSGEAWRPPCELGLCSFNTLHPPPLSQLPRVTAQTLPSALRGDVIKRGHRPTRNSQQSGAAVSPQKGKRLSKFSSFM